MKETSSIQHYPLLFTSFLHHTSLHTFIMHMYSNNYTCSLSLCFVHAVSFLLLLSLPLLMHSCSCVVLCCFRSISVHITSTSASTRDDKHFCFAHPSSYCMSIVSSHSLLCVPFRFASLCLLRGCPSSFRFFSSFLLFLSLAVALFVLFQHVLADSPLIGKSF